MQAELTALTRGESILHLAQRVLLSTDLAEKVRDCGPVTRDEPHAVEVPDEPGRPTNLQFAAPRTAPGMPKPVSLRQTERCGVAHHIMANHELQAAEVMAATLLKFPDAPAEFRVGMAAIIRDEQRHTRMHMALADAYGVPFGSLPVNAYIWAKSRQFDGLLDYVAGLPLVFEGANLDHSLELADAFEDAGRPKSAHVMRRIHDDEVGHVQFGLDWLRRWKADGENDWDAFVKHLHFPLKPALAIGAKFQEDARRRAGLDEHFIGQLRALHIAAGG